MQEVQTDPNVCDIANSWTYFFYAHQDLIMIAILVPLIALVVLFAKAQQKRVLKHNADMFQKNHDMIARSLENQEKMVALLQEISGKLSKK